MHFFNPVPVMQLVEMVRGLQTADETCETVIEISKKIIRFDSRVVHGGSWSGHGGLRPFGPPQHVRPERTD